MTYRELAPKILAMDSSQMDANVTIYVSSNEEYYSGILLDFSDEFDDVLTNEHPYLILDM